MLNNETEVFQEHFRQTIHVLHAPAFERFAEQRADIWEKIKCAVGRDAGQSGNFPDQLHRDGALGRQLLQVARDKRVVLRRERLQRGVLDQIAGIRRDVALKIGDGLDDRLRRGEKSGAPSPPCNTTSTANR